MAAYFSFSEKKMENDKMRNCIFFPEKNESNCSYTDSTGTLAALVQFRSVQRVYQSWSQFARRLLKIKVIGQVQELRLGA